MTSHPTFLHTIRPFLQQDQLTSNRLEIVQLNLGPRCNLECRHCHLAASPRRSESMSWPVIEQALQLVAASGCQEVDLTGGAPEYHPHLRPLIEKVSAMGVRIQLRSNLAVLMEPQQHDLAAFLCQHRVALTASLPCYLQQNVDSQRGDGVYQQAVAALQHLNSLGYGMLPELPLNLVYNPGRAVLPPNQARLEQDYRLALRQSHGIAFHRLFTLTNMPIGRFLADLRRTGQEEHYGQLLRDSFNPATLEPLMCRKQITIRWDGTLFDCDFNLALGWQATLPQTTPMPVYDPVQISQRPIVTGNHCFACTAGCGSSCGGALAA
ncbi:MAG: arsenosugar biosynthesis radical SAM protein ArsS [Magnetococcales bacterium]|nr:arsenosugar biosynthesis radical SAM protein ArsS [Magnetococcales bacterium]